jgi:transposase
MLIQAVGVAVITADISPALARRAGQRLPPGHRHRPGLPQPARRGAVAKGITDNQRKRTKIAEDGLRLARRLRDHQDMILRFTTDLTVGFTSNEAERGVRPVKVQQRTSGGCWRTLEGLADFAVVQSYLSTAGKWRIDALTQLFTDGPWLPAAIRPG